MTMQQAFELEHIGRPYTAPPLVAVLFARADSAYRQLEGVDVWDEARDARRWTGGVPVIAHPPCRAWGRLAHMAKPLEHEKELARWAVAQVRRWGGVLEHPHASRLWADQQMPPAGQRDAFGGWTFPITQHWWGHRAEKRTWLYIVGVGAAGLPDMPPLQLGRGTHVVAQDSRGRRERSGNRVRPGDPEWRPSVTHAEREATPIALARWLVELARRCQQPQRAAA